MRGLNVSMQWASARRGFTLIEVLVALVVAGIAAMGIVRLQMIGVQAAVYSDLSARAALLAESRIEQALAVARAEFEHPRPGEGTVRVESPPAQLRWQLDVEDGAGFFEDMEDDLIRIWRLRCRVSWDMGGRVRSIELTRYTWDYNFDFE